MAELDLKVKAERVILEKFEVAVSRAMFGTILNLERYVGYDEISERLVLSLKAWMLAKTHNVEETTRTFRWPRGWWQHFKEDLFPEWLKRIFPVRWEKETVLISRRGPIHVCPHSDMKWPDRRHIEFMLTEEEQP